MSQGVDELLEQSSPLIRELALETRALITDVYPEAVEVPWPKQKVVGYGVGPKKMSEHFCWIGFAKYHVDLGFYYGTELPDPTHLLEGTGKLLRHVKLRALADVRNPALCDLVIAASTHRMPAVPSHKRQTK